MSECSAAIMNEGKVFIECSLGLNGEGTGDVFFNQIVEVEVVGEEAPVEVGVQLKTEEGDVLERVPRIHDEGKEDMDDEKEWVGMREGAQNGE